MRSIQTATGLLLILCVGLPGQEPTSPPAVKVPSAPALATSTQGTDATPVDIVLTLQHAPPSGVECKKVAGGGCEEMEHWQALVSVSGKAEVFPMVASQRWQAALQTAAAPKAKKAAVGTISESTLSIRATAMTPYAVVQRTMHVAALAGVPRIEFAVMSTETPAVERRLAAPLPFDEGAAKVEEKPVGEKRVEEPKPKLVTEASGRLADLPLALRISLHWDATANNTVRQFGKTVVRDDAHLQALITEWLKDDKRPDKGEKDKKPYCIIDASGLVPWQAIVNVIDASRAAGVQTIEFAAGGTVK